MVGGDGGDRTRVRKYSALGSTCLVSPFNLIFQTPADQDFEERVCLGFNVLASVRLDHDQV